MEEVGDLQTHHVIARIDHPHGDRLLDVRADLAEHHHTVLLAGVVSKFVPVIATAVPGTPARASWVAVAPELRFTTTVTL